MIRCLAVILLALVANERLRAQRIMQYSDLVINGNKVWALTNTGRLHVIDLQGTMARGLPVPGHGGIVALSMDRQSGVVVGTRDRHISVYDSLRHRWRTLGNHTGKLYAITFDSRNDCYLITSEGLVDLYHHKTYWPDSTLNRSFWPVSVRVQVLSACYMDKQDDLWLGFDLGEWGGDLFVFDTRLKIFHLPRFDLYGPEPVRSIFSDGLWTYVSMGLAHFSTSGSIYRLRYYCSAQVLYSSTRREKDTVIYGEYIGPAAFNTRDSGLYFYSQNGIFRGDRGRDLSRLDAWEKVAQPKLWWSSGQPMAVGSPMNVKKMIFTDDGRLVFLTQLNGIGVMTGRTISFLPAFRGK